MNAWIRALRHLQVCLMASLLALGPALVSSDEGTARLLRLVSRADYASLAACTCSDEGLSFAPYARNLSVLHLTRLSRSELKGFAESKRPIDWGRYDGSGQAILLTPMEYHKQFIYDVDYLRLASVTRLDVGQLHAQVELGAVAAAFPQSEALIYRFAGTASLDHKDRRELILIGRRVDGHWCLDALAHSEDTV